MKKLTIVTALILSACTASSVAAPKETKPKVSAIENPEFFDCLNELGPKQDKGFDRCQKLL